MKQAKVTLFYAGVEAVEEFDQDDLDGLFIPQGSGPGLALAAATEAFCRALPDGQFFQFRRWDAGGRGVHGLGDIYEATDSGGNARVCRASFVYEEKA